MDTGVIVVMGVAGAGKTLIGEMLAEKLHGVFADADSFHSQSNKAKMAAGTALTDEDRRPWLQAMRSAIQSWLAEGGVHVLACSALKNSYRDILQCDKRVHFIYLKVGKQLATHRLQARPGHYMKSNMVDSQFATLEEPDETAAISIDARQTPTEILDEICKRLLAV